MISPVCDWGSALPEIGLGVEKPQITELWQVRQGTYEVINAEDDFPILSPWDLELREGFLFLAGDIFGSKNMLFLYRFYRSMNRMLSLAVDPTEDALEKPLSSKNNLERRISRIRGTSTGR